MSPDCGCKVFVEGYTEYFVIKDYESNNDGN